MAKTVSKILGIAFILVGILGFFAPGFLGTHLSMPHNLVHLVSGALALYFGMFGSLAGAKYFCIAFGVVYFLLGVAGFVAGSPGAPTMSGMEHMGSDPRLLRVIPGTLELGTHDHALHVLLGLIFLVAGVATKTSPGRVSAERPRMA